MSVLDEPTVIAPDARRRRPRPNLDGAATCESVGDPGTCRTPSIGDTAYEISGVSLKIHSGDNVRIMRAIKS